MKDLNNNLQSKTNIQQKTISTSDSNKYDNSKTMREVNKLIVTG